jgi:glycosyltransferase involved in cell wall biosynthesis
MASCLPWDFGVIAPKLPSGQYKRWNPQIRPLLQNIKIYFSVQEAFQDGPWDWVLTHNVNDLLDSRPIPIPKTYLVHGTLSGRILQDHSTIDRTLYLRNLRLLLKSSNARVVYISDLKRRDWGMPGDVIRPAIDLLYYGGYHGKIRGVIQVCNRLKERGEMMGWSVYESVSRDIPNIVIGENPNLPDSRMSDDWEDLREQLRSYRIYLYTPQYPYEDGYNLALLEAMATGMPVASLQHITLPVRDGVEGAVAASPEELRRKVIELLNNPEEAFRLGEGARLRVAKEFAVSDFQRAWESLAAKLLRN